MLAKIQNPRINYLSRILAFSIIVFTVLAFTLRTKTLTTNSVKLEKPITVVIDAGHGLMENGQHSGAKVEDIFEDDITLAIANKIKELNTNEQIKIVFTRPTEQITDLHKRVDIARENNADLFLSLHINALPPNSGTGLEKEVSGFEIYVSNKPNAFQQKSEILGSVLREELNSVYPTETSLYKRQTGVWVLDQNVCPSVLVECGWLTTKKDRDFITKEKNQEEVARKILDAVQRYALNQQTQKTGLDVIRDTVPNGSIKQGKVIMESTNVTYVSKPDGGPVVKKLFIINGKRVDPSTLYGKQITSKKAIFYEKDQAEAITKYGNEAKNGVFIFEDAKVEKLTESEARRLYLDTIPKKQVIIQEVTLENPKASDQDNVFRNKWDPLNPPIIILDGKEVAEKDVKKINANSISSMTVLKGQTAIELYGEKAKNGAILIETNSKVEVKEVTLSPLTDTVPKKGNEDVNQIFTKVEIEPSVDQKQWIRHLQTQLQRYIEAAAANGIDPGTYTIQIRFLVLKDGSVTDVKALNNLGYGLTEAAVKTVQNGPKWNPGLQNGKPVNAYHTQPITFVVQEQGNDEKKKPSASPEVTLEQLKKWDYLYIENLVSFVLVGLDNKGDLVKRYNLTSKLDEPSKALLAMQRPGNIISFENILVKENGKEVKKPAFFYTVR